MSLIQFINIDLPPKQVSQSVPKQASPSIPKHATPLQATKKPQNKFKDNILEKNVLKDVLKAGILQTTADGGIPLTNITGICYTLAAYNFIARLRYLLVTEVTTLINHEEIKEFANKNAKELTSIQIDNYNKYLVLQSFAELMNKNMFSDYTTDRIHFIRSRLSQLKFSATEYSYLNKYLTVTFDNVINIAKTVYDKLPEPVKDEIRDSNGEKDGLINLELVKKTQRINYNINIAKGKKTKTKADNEYNAAIKIKKTAYDNELARRSNIISHLKIPNFTDAECIYFFNYIQEMTRPGYLEFKSYAEEEKEKLFVDSTYIIDNGQFNNDRYKIVLEEYKNKIILLVKYCTFKNIDFENIDFDLVLCNEIIDVINHYLTTEKFKVDASANIDDFFDPKVYNQIFSLSSNQCIGDSALLPSTYILGILNSEHILNVSINEFNTIGKQITNNIYYINVRAGGIVLNNFISNYNTYNIHKYKICGLLLNCDDIHSIFVTCYDNNCDNSLFNVINDNTLLNNINLTDNKASYGNYCSDNSKIKIESILYEIAKPPPTI